MLSKIITGDETWYMGMILKLDFSHHSGRFLVLRRTAVSVPGKVMLIVFLDISGVVHHEYIPKGQTVNQHVYKEVLIHLQDAIRCKRPELWSSVDYYLHHDNAPAHLALKVHNYLAKNRVFTLLQPPYSPDLAPSDFCPIPKLKMVMKGQCYDDVDAVLRISRESVEQCMQAWVNRLDHSISSSGCHFEGDKSD